MDTDRMRSLVAELARAKSRRDTTAAIAVQHDEMLLEVPAMGARVRGREANRRALERFFATFPDYAVMLEGSARSGDELVAWGAVTMRTVRIPAFFRFAFRDDRISQEYFLWDAAAACSEWGISPDALRTRPVSFTSASAV